jgi:hypothetical protein
VSSCGFVRSGVSLFPSPCAYITPEINGKLPGYLSPSAGFKFADVTYVLDAISKVPAAGRGHIPVYRAFCETSQDQSPGTAASKGNFGFKDVPSGLAAIDRMPVEGRMRWDALCGSYETVADKPNASEPGSYGMAGGASPARSWRTWRSTRAL